MAIDRKNLGILLLAAAGAYIAYQYYLQSTVGESDSETDPTDSVTTSSLADTLQTGWENLVNTFIPAAWMTTGEGPVYQDTFNQVESQYGIPQNLLFRIGYQESHFRPDIISGATTSSAGAVGIMQLMPHDFPGAGEDPATDIATAGEYLAKLYNEFGDWQIATAAYNDGPGNLTKILAGSKQMPLETQNYIQSVFADVPVPGSLIAVA